MKACFTLCCCCINSFSSKCLEIALIIFQSLSILALICFISIINLSFISTSNIIIVIIIFIILIIQLIFLIFFRKWRSNGTIKEINLTKAKVMSYFCMLLVIICLIISIVSEILIQSDIKDIEKISCDINNDRTSDSIVNQDNTNTTDDEYNVDNRNINLPNIRINDINLR